MTLRLFMVRLHNDGTETRHYEVLSYNRETHTMHCQWPHGAEFDWQFDPQCEWTKKFYRLTREDDDA